MCGMRFGPSGTGLNGRSCSRFVSCRWTVEIAFHHSTDLLVEHAHLAAGTTAILLEQGRQILRARRAESAPHRMPAATSTHPALQLAKAANHDADLVATHAVHQTQRIVPLRVQNLMQGIKH